MALSSLNNIRDNVPTADKNLILHPPAEAAIRTVLAGADVMCVRVIGPPGSGKTELIEATLRRLPCSRRIAVIAVNPASSREVDQLRDLCGRVSQINAPIPKASAILRVISELHLTDFDIIFIEGSNGMIPLADIGQDATVAVFAVSGGDDKAAEYRTLLESAALVLLTKNDVRSLVKFNEAVFRNDVRIVNADADIYELSAANGSGMDRWIEWLERMRMAKRRRNAPPENEPHMGEWFIA